MSTLSDILIGVAIAFYLAAFACYATDLSRTRVRRRFRDPERAQTQTVGPAARQALPGRREPSAGVSATPQPSRAARMADALVGIALAANAAGVLARALAGQRAPWGNMYEFAVVGAASIAAAYLVVLRRHRVEGLGVWVVGLVLVVLGAAVTVLYTPVDALIPVLDSYWLAIHVGAAIVAGGAFTLAAVASGTFLVRTRRLPRDDPAPRGDNRLERVAYGMVVFAFPVWTFAVIAGAVWAEAAWGRYWGWDPKETWAFITWVLFAAYLHAQSTAGWRGRRAAWLCLLGYAAFLFNFIGVNIWVGGLHSYAGV